MGLDFQFTPRRFPTLELMASTEMACREMEAVEFQVLENKERAQRVRSVVATHIEKFADIKRKSNVTKKEMLLIKKAKG